MSKIDLWTHDYRTYGYIEDRLFMDNFGPVMKGVDLDRVYQAIDHLEALLGTPLRERMMEHNPATGETQVLFRVDARSLVERQDYAEYLHSMLRWLMLKLSKEELHFLGVVPATADPASFTPEQLLAGLTEEFERFRRADERLRQSIGQSVRKAFPNGGW